MDAKKKKNLLIGGGIMTGVLVAAAGITLVVMSGEEEPKSKPGYSTSTPTAQDTAAQPGQISIEPMAIQITRAPDGTLSGIGTISALFQEFTPSTVTITGDKRVSWKSDCLSPSKPIPAGERCNIIVSFTENGPAPAQPVETTLVVMGNSKTPGGSVQPVEASATIITNPNAASIGPDGMPIAGGIAPAGLDPYGPVTPLPYGQQIPGQAPIAGGPVGPPMAGGPSAPTAPPMDYTQTPVPASQPTLTPQQQFLLARRQAVLGKIRSGARAQPQQPKPQGTWADLNVPTSTSSYAQDMSRVVTMDRIITAVIARTYDSRSSQQIVAQVDRNVYGSHGRTILIPRGSTLIGIAEGGGERVGINWKQIIRPDGARFMIEATSGDAMGQAGVPGRINNRWMKRFGGVLLGTILKAGTARIFDASEEAGTGVSVGGSGTARNNGAIISDIVREDIAKITQDIERRNQNIQPIVTVPSGTRITVIPTMDLQLRPLQGRQIEVQSYPRPMNAGAAAPSRPGRNAPEGDGYDVPISSNRQENVSTYLQPTAPETSSSPPWNEN